MTAAEFRALAQRARALAHDVPDDVRSARLLELERWSWSYRRTHWSGRTSPDQFVLGSTSMSRGLLLLILAGVASVVLAFVGSFAGWCRLGERRRSRPVLGTP